MTRHQALIDQGVALFDAGHAHDQRAPVLASRAGPAAFVVLAQHGDDLFAQLSFGHGIDGGVDGLVADALGRLHLCQCAANLLGRQIGQRCVNALPQGVARARAIANDQFGRAAGLGCQAAGAFMGGFAPVAVDASGA